MHTLELDQYNQSGVNITGLRMIDPSNRTIDLVTQWSDWERLSGKNFSISAKSLTVLWRIRFDQVKT